MLLLAAEYTATPPPLQSSQAQLPLLLAGLVSGVGQEIAVDIAVEADEAFSVQISQGGSNDVIVDVAVETSTAFDASPLATPPVTYEIDVDLAEEVDDVFDVLQGGLLNISRAPGALSLHVLSPYIPTPEWEEVGLWPIAYPSASTYPVNRTSGAGLLLEVLEKASL